MAFYERPPPSAFAGVSFERGEINNPGRRRQRKRDPVPFGECDLSEATDDENGPIKIYRRVPDHAAPLLRKAIAALGFPEHCGFKACRRTRTCATRHLLCWQVNHEEMNREILLMSARTWKRASERGEPWPDVDPDLIRRYERALAEEAGELDGLRDRLRGSSEEAAS
jgi:hypothetical protein